MKLHLPLLLRKILLSAFVSFVGISSSANAEKICGLLIDEKDNPFRQPISQRENYAGNDRLTVCHCDTGGIYSLRVNIYDIGYVLVYNNEDTSAISEGTYGLKIYDCPRVVFKDNESSDEYTYDITGVSALAGGGAISGTCDFYNIEDLIFSGNRATQGVGGAIDSDGGPVSIYNCNNVIFTNNYAKIGGGAIGLYGHGKGWFGSYYHYLTISAISESIKFSNNRAGEDGGAIHARYAYINGNKGKIVFAGNEAGEYGGAIYLDGYTGSNPWRTLYLHNNDEVIFRNNCAGVAGGAIYLTSTKGTAYITNNESVIFKDNICGAIYSSGNVQIQGNDEIVFRGNGVAIDAAGWLSLSTSESEQSSIRIYDAINVDGSMSLNTLTPVYGEEGGTANGTVLFSGEQSVSHVVGQVTVGAGKVVLEKGATLRTDSSFSHKGGALRIGQYKDSGTVLDVASAYTFTADGGGTLTFDLDYNVDSAVSLVTVGGNLSLIGDCLQIDDSGLSGNAATIALLSVGSNIKYEGKTYTFSGGDWSYTSNNVRYTLPMEAILVSDALKDGAALEWRDKTLYYTTANTDVWEYSVKGLGEDLTWRGDVFHWYDTNKPRVEMGTRERDLSCWVAAASNVIQYWQDRYAPLYQGDENLTTNQISGIRTAHRVYQQLLDKFEAKENAGKTVHAVKQWFSSASGKRFTENTGAWNTFDIEDHVKNPIVLNLGYDEFRKALDSAFSASESGIVLSFVYCDRNWLTSELERTGGHGVTVWSAEFYTNSSQEQVCELHYTDSDYDASSLSTMVVKFSDECGAYIYQYRSDGSVADEDLFLDGRVTVLETLTYIETPKGMADMLEDYNSDHTFYWTGNAAGKLWTTQEKENWYEGMHLATTTDGWKKECSGGGKTIYAHAYVTAEQMGASHFIFDDAVDGKVLSSSQRSVVLEDGISPASVTVRGDYEWKGNGALLNSQLTVEDGAHLGLSGPQIKGCTIELDGCISNDTVGDSTIQDSTIEVGAGGELWMVSLTLTEGAIGGTGITIDGRSFAVSGRENGLLVNRVEAGCHFGAVLDFQGAEYNGTVEQLSENTTLNMAFYKALVADGNQLEENENMYDWDYLPINFTSKEDGSSNVDGQRVVAQSTLTIITPSGASGIMRTIGSHRVSPGETGADISVSETLGGTVSSDVALMTLPSETVYLNESTNITAPELTVAEESTLTNEGGIDGKLMVEAFGTLGGSGNFGATTVYDSGRLMVGSSPGAPRYESLTMKSGSELIFCLDGSIPASAEKQGWGSGTHSVLHVTQPGGLVVENGTTVSVGCSLDFLNQSPLGERQTLSLVQLAAAGDAALLTALQSGTQFMLAEADDSLSSLTEVGAHVHHAQWEQGADNTLKLSFIVSSYPEDALIWTNASGDGIWNEISQNWETLSGTASLFAAGRNVAFYQGGTVVLNDKVTVGDVVVSTAEHLRWEGNGGIAGSGTLVKEGPGTLTVATDNSDFDGRVEIYGGRLTATATTSLGSGTVVLDGGTLEIGADGIGNAIMNASDGTVEVASGITHQLKETIYNVGTLKLIGRFDAGELEAVASEQNKRVDVNGLVRKDGEGSGFLRTGDAEVTVAGNLGDPHTVDSSAAVILYKGKTLEMNNGVGVVAGTVDYSKYLLTGEDSTSVSKIAEQAGALLRDIEMNGGHLSVNTDCDVLKATAGEVLLQGSRLGGSIGGSTSVSVSGESELSGDNCYSGGTILRDGAALTIGHDNALGCGIVTNEGIGSIDVREEKRLTLHRAIANSGTLSLCGALDAGKLNLDIEVVGYVDMDGKATTGSGFVKAASYAVQLVEGGKTVNAGARVTHDGYRMRSELLLGEDGVARAGGGVDYSRFYLTGEDAVSVSAVDAVSEAKGSDLQDVWMDGGELEVDADITVDALGGSIVITDDSVLRGTIADTDITAGAGDYTSDITANISGGSKVTVNGGAVTLSGANSYTGGTIVNAGTLVAGSDMAFGTGEVELRGGVMELNQRPLENKLLAQGGIISGGSGFRGAVVFNGSVGLRGNLSASSVTINSGSVLTLNGSTISVSGSLTLGGAAVLNLNGSDFGDGDVLITFGSLSGSKELLTVEYGADSDKYSVEKKGNALILAWLDEPKPEENPLPEPEKPQPEEEPLPEPEMPEPEIPTPTLDREDCDALVQSSWGVFTASHAFADAIGGQRSAAGYVGRPESVAWVSALGGMHRIDGTGSCSGSDIDLFGAAVGLEHYMSATEAVGIAVGRLSGDVQLKNSGREMEQEGTYIGVYGTHQLAEFARTDSLNLRWNAVYGDTETEGSIGQEEMSRTQDSVQLNARLSWTSLLSDAWVLNLFAGMEYFASESAENEESEEARVRMGSIQNLRGELGIGTRYTSGSTSLYGEVRYLNDMVRSNPYAEINGLRGYGANPGRQGIGVTLGAQQELGNGWSVHASYSLEAMSEATMHSANIGAALRF